MDDDIELALTYQALLQVHGYRVSTAADGSQALKLVLHGDVDAVLCDLQMPELTGDLFYFEVGRARPHLLKRFIFVTGHPGESHLEGEIAQWNVPVVAKPFTIAQLTTACAPYLQSSPPSAISA